MVFILPGGFMFSWWWFSCFPNPFQGLGNSAEAQQIGPHPYASARKEEGSHGTPWILTNDAVSFLTSPRIAKPFQLRPIV